MNFIRRRSPVYRSRQLVVPVVNSCGFAFALPTFLFEIFIPACGG
jgi:hypothetical protein